MLSQKNPVEEPVNTEAVDLVQVFSWQQYDWLHHGFSTRWNGVSTVYNDHTLNSAGQKKTRLPT